MAWLNLAKVLDEKKCSGSELARRLGVTYTTVAKYFKKDYDPKFSTILRWAEALECEIEDLIDHSLSSNKKTMSKPSSAKAAVKIQNRKKNRKGKRK